MGCKIILLIDDQRTFNVDIIARNFTSGVDCLTSLPIHVLYLDFDLGIGVHTEKELTGLDILKEVAQTGHLPPEIVLVTQNPVGIERMSFFLLNKGYSRLGHKFIK